MDFLCHAILGGHHVVFSSFVAVILREKSPDRLTKINFLSLSLVLVHSMQKGIGTWEQVRKRCNWRKEASFRL